MSDAPELMDIKQAAQFLNVSETSLRRWTNEGRLACLRVGRRRERRFTRSHLEGFLEQQPAGEKSRSRTGSGGVPVAPGSHFCSLYSSDLSRARQAAGYLADGLREGSVCFLVAEPDARDQILKRLKRARNSVRSAIEGGRLVMPEYIASANDQYWLWETQFVAATRAGASSLRAVRDVSGGRLTRGKRMRKIIQFELGYDRLIAKRFPVVMLCQYDVRRLSGTDVAAVLGCHGDDFRYPVQRLIG